MEKVARDGNRTPLVDEAVVGKALVDKALVDKAIAAFLGSKLREKSMQAVEYFVDQESGENRCKRFYRSGERWRNFSDRRPGEW